MATTFTCQSIPLPTSRDNLVRILFQVLLFLLLLICCSFVQLIFCAFVQLIFCAFVQLQWLITCAALSVPASSHVRRHCILDCICVRALVHICTCIVRLHAQCVVLHYSYVHWSLHSLYCVFVTTFSSNTHFCALSVKRLLSELISSHWCSMCLRCRPHDISLITQPQ